MPITLDQLRGTAELRDAVTGEVLYAPAGEERRGQSVATCDDVKPKRPPAPFRTTAKRRLTIRLTVPIRVVNESNVRGQARAYMARKAATKAIMAEVLPAFKVVPPGPWRVTLTRYGTRVMDGDGLQSALKVIRDCVAAWLGCDDGDTDRVRWRYRQRGGFVGGVGVEVRET